MILETIVFSRGPVILVVMEFSFSRYNSKISNILWVGYPGEVGGDALAEIIFGYHKPNYLYIFERCRR
jgi:beta-D-xylosidase 4